MNKITWNRRIVLAAASVTLIGGGVALPATAMAAPTAPQHAVTLAPQDGDHGDDDPGLHDGDLSVPGVMGGDLMDPDYPPGDEGDSWTPNSNGGSSVTGGDWEDDNTMVGGDATSGGHTGSSKHHGSGSHKGTHKHKGSDDDLDDVLDLEL
ncbi:hypothetical protein [Streptomyces sp. NPDC006463]|uniref:hypothetical protein n=1 Tax=Streptomyces sp. NPDC006463 TaxID=3364746 RepID=UPI0036C93056